MRLIEKLFKQSYITLKLQSLDKIAIFGGFLREKVRSKGQRRLNPPRDTLRAPN
jgi:hypothetical protein